MTDKPNRPIGVPYAPGAIDARGNLYTICPICGLHCYADGDSGFDNDEDNVTKGAARAYAFHYVAEHEDGDR